MKITEMLKREDFYPILEQTLALYGEKIGIAESDLGVRNVNWRDSLYINVHLNALLSAHPSRSVKHYLYAEYNVSGPFMRRMIVKTYLWAATHFIPLFAQKSVRIAFRDNPDISNILIYPCNKKIRWFDFKKGIVFTFLKYGFPSLYIDREISFRLSRKESFVPRICQYGKGFYSERIICGKPLARIHDESHIELCKREALRCVVSMTDESKKIAVSEYIESIKENCLEQLRQKPSFIESDFVRDIFETVLHVNSDEEITLVMSHGDLQPGNIWVGKDNQIMVIDWETVKMRSCYYDFVALFYDLRKKRSYQRVAKLIASSNEIERVGDTCSLETIIKIVFAEELAYQTEELISFPGEIGINGYLQVLSEIKDMEL